MRNQPVRVLLIDDDEDDCLLVRDLLSAISYVAAKLEWVADYDAALVALEQYESDVCLLDYQLGRRNGLELMKEALSRGIRTPFVFLTNHGNFHLDLEVMRAGAADYLTKGELSAPLLERSIRYAMEHKRKQDALLKAGRIIQSLSECNDAVIRVKSEMELLREICRIVVEVGGYRMAWVGYAEQDGDQGVIPVAKYGYEEGYLETVKITLRDAERGKDPTSGSICTGKPVILRFDENHSELDHWRAEATKRDYESVIGLPLFLDERVLGALTIYASQSDAFNAEEVELLVKLASNLAYGVGALRAHRARELAEKSLREACNALQTRVEERTADLVKANAKLEREVGERILVEKALRESDERLKLALTASGMGVWEWDAKTNGIFCSEKCFEITGVDSSSRTLESFTNIVHPEDFARIRVTARQALAERMIYAEEFRIISPSGEVRWVSNLGRAEYDDNGKPLRFVGTIKDITESKRAEQALQESEEHYRSLFDNMLNGFAYCKMLFEQDRPIDFTYLNVNSAFRTLTGLKNVIGKKVSEVIPGIQESDPELFEVYGRVALTGVSERFETYVEALGMWFSISLYSPQKEYFVAVFDVITERKQAMEALRTSLEEKVALLKEVHHRVKNNLQIVASLLSLQANRSQNQHVIDVLQDTRNRVRSISLLHEMLYRSGNLARVNFASYVGDLCGQLLQSFGSMAAKLDVENHIGLIGLPLELAVPCGLIINELVSNALKHGFPGERAGRVTVELNPAEGQMLVLCVRDNGVGLPSGLDPANTATLGLKMVSKLAGQLNGQLTMMDQPDGVGTAFSVVFPVPENILIGK